MDISDSRLEIRLPKIKDAGYKVTSPETKEYNCIAWAAGRNDIWIWPRPDFFWPEYITPNDKLSSFIKFYQTLGYSVCENDKLEIGYEKIAIYVTPNIDNVTHAARQTESGKWTSKLGPYKDIEHSTLDCLTGSDYGKVAIIMKRNKT